MDLNALLRIVEWFVTELVVLGSIIISPLLISRLAEARKKRMTSFHGPYTFGSAHFASQEEVADFLPSPQQLAAEPYLLLGFYYTHLAALPQKRQESHVLLIAPTGQGKSSGIMIPGLLSETGARSLFINDTKSELVGACYGWLSQSHTCFILSPTKPENSHRYNPLAHVVDMEDAEDLASAIVANTGESKEAFWENTARLLLTASILHVKSVNPHVPFSTLIEMLTTNKLTDLQEMLTQSASLQARAVATSFIQSLSMNERLGGSIMVEVASRLFSMTNPAISAMTSDNEIDFDQFINTPTAIFLSVPASQATRLKWFGACFIMQLMKHLTRKAEETAHKRLLRPCALYLDEFGNSVIPHFPQYISLVRSAGIALLMAIQSHDQLVKGYQEEGKNTILANATTHVVFPGCGLPETTYYSERLGETTVTVASKSHESPQAIIFPRTTVTYSEAQRRLMTSDEIRRLSPRHLLIVSDNIAPLIVLNRAYFEIPQMKQRAGLPYNLPYRTPMASLPPAPQVQTGPRVQKPQTPSGAQQTDSDQFFSP
jgi:type IV secretion system protein VirD4